jgi:NAD(P)-dependent dehydrogenase (short-subunit alcohol dehydrogenase family)
MSERLQDKVVIVTGASAGIGYAIAAACAREGAVTVIASRNEEKANAGVARIRKEGGTAEFIRTDVTDRQSVESVVSGTISKHGRVDVLINNAGVREAAPFWEETEEMWNKMYRTNVLGTVFISQAVVRHMKERGSGAIVHITSKAGVVGEPGHAAYSSSKGAVIALTREMAAELGPLGIRVNGIAPGPVETEMLDGALPDQAARDALAQEAPGGRIGKPEDIAHLAVYLASDESALVVGQTVSIDGGLSILK